MQKLKKEEDKFEVNVLFDCPPTHHVAFWLVRALECSFTKRRQLDHTLINPVFLSSSYLTLLPLVISTTCRQQLTIEQAETPYQFGKFTGLECNYSYCLNNVNKEKISYWRFQNPITYLLEKWINTIFGTLNFNYESSTIFLAEY